MGSPASARAHAPGGLGGAREQHWAPAAGELERRAGEGDDDEQHGKGGEQGDASHVYTTRPAPTIFP